jgi:hypothetical protein
MKKLLRKLFVKEQPRNIYHPDYADKIVPAVTIDGTRYYSFKDELDMPYGRYQYLATFLQAIELRMDLKTLNAYVDRIEAALSLDKGKIKLGDAVIALTQLRTRTKILFDIELAYNIASCVYFTEDEILNSYSMEANKNKIEAWRRSGSLDFFMSQPVKRLLGLGDLSTSDLMIYLSKTQPIMDELNLAMRQVISKEN